MKKMLLIITILLGLNCYTQTNVITNNKLIINHGDVTLYLSDDTSTMVSKHVLSYSNYKKLKTVPRDNHWFKDTYDNGKSDKKAYVNSGYDLGHLTPSDITSYDAETNHSSFSLFNQAPQLAHFNEHPWEQLEMHVEDSIGKYKEDVVIITGVIYDYNSSTPHDFLYKSRVRIPIAYYKILVLKTKTYCWVGSNNNESILPTTISELNKMFKINKMTLTIN
jgi:DNA/RNA endonuclease G (NUC1)